MSTTVAANALASHWSTTLRDQLALPSVNQKSVEFCAEAAKRHGFRYEVSADCRHIDVVKAAFAKVYGADVAQYLLIKPSLVPDAHEIALAASGRDSKRRLVAA